MKRSPSTCSAWESLRDQVRNGDVLAFSGKGNLSEFIKWASSSRYSHVGILLRLPVNGDTRVFILESTTQLDLQDEFDRRVISGVQMHLVSKRLAAYEGEVWYVPIADRYQYEDQAIAWALDSEVKHRPYDYVQALGAAADFLDRFGLTNAPDFDKLFCSEFVARIDEIGLGLTPMSFPDYFGGAPNASEVLPSQVVSAKHRGIPIKLT